MKELLDMNRIPQHIAIIMDGNGRWAMERGKERSFGHQAGVDAVRRITSECTRLGVKFLTLYTFSTENWNRPADEVAALMGLVLTSLEDEIFMKNNVRFRVIAQEVKDGKLNAADITEETINERLWTNFMPDPELLIRTGGEVRISNYLLWQIAYSELYFCDTYWPDFMEEDLHKAIYNYQSRQRRFGKTEAQVEENK